MTKQISLDIAEMVELVSKLVACDTVNPPGNEYKSAAVVAAFCDKYNIPYAVYSKTRQRDNIVASLGNGEKTLLMAAHMDVVPVGDGWNTNPFEMVVKDGKMWGRGVSDDKGPLAGLLMMLKHFAQHPDQLNCNLVVVAAADEERGSAEGLKYLVDKGIVAPNFVVIGDIAGHCLEVDVAEKGVAQYELKTMGKQAHAAVPHEGRNAVYAMCDWISRVRSAEFKYEKHPILSPPTRNIGKIGGGIAPNVVPADCTAVLDTRILPGMNPEELRLFLLDLAKLDADRNPDVTYSVELKAFLPPTELSTDNPYLSTLMNAIKSVKGTEGKFIGSGGATDCKAFILKGIPAVAFGPGDDNVAHLANEYLGIDELTDFTRIVIECAASFR